MTKRKLPEKKATNLTEISRITQNGDMWSMSINMAFDDDAVDNRLIYQVVMCSNFKLYV